MKELPEEFTYDGFRFSLRRRSERAAIYEQQWIGKDGKFQDGSISYEVIIPQITNRRFNRETMKFEGCEPYESYPASEQWGDYGWTHTDLESATRRYDALCASAQTRSNRFDGRRDGSVPGEMRIAARAETKPAPNLSKSRRR